MNTYLQVDFKNVFCQYVKLQMIAIKAAKFLAKETFAKFEQNSRKLLQEQREICNAWP